MQGRIKIIFLWLIAIVTRYSGLDSIVRYVLSPSVTILTFHRLGEALDPLLLTVSQQRFALITNLLFKKSSILSLSDALILLYGTARRRHAYVLTFDDGYADNYFLKTYAESGIPITIYIAGKHVDSEILWPFKLSHVILNSTISEIDLSDIGYGVYSLLSEKERIFAIRQINQRIKQENNNFLQKIVDLIVLRCACDSLPASERMLTSRELEKLRDLGVTIGAHTLSHAILTRIPIDEARQEIVHSVAMIRKLIGDKKNIHFAYPNGTAEDFDDKVVTCVKESGCASAVTTIFGINRKYTDTYRLRRIPVTQYSFLNPLGKFSVNRFLSETSGLVAFLKEFKFNDSDHFPKK